MRSNLAVSPDYCRKWRGAGIGASVGVDGGTERMGVMLTRPHRCKSTGGSWMLEKHSFCVADPSEASYEASCLPRVAVLWVPQRMFAGGGRYWDVERHGRWSPSSQVRGSALAM